MLDTAADWSHSAGSILAPVFYFRLLSYYRSGLGG